MRFLASLATASLLFVAVNADAFTVSSPLTDACHEQITEAALAIARASHTGLSSIDADANDRAFIDDLPFPVSAEDEDLAAAALLVGVRDNDLKGRAVTDLDQLAFVHGNPRLQDEHCLRAPGDDEPTGSQSALERCKAFIRERAMQAVDGLGTDGLPDPNNRVDLDVSLSIRGKVTVSLPRFWVRIGQAMHAVQDSFSHAYRTSDGTKITVVLNWVDLVDGKETPSRDGPPHKIDLDQCNAGDALRTRNKELATRASSELLAAVLAPDTDRAEKAAAVDAVLSRYMTYEPGCTFENDWCHAPENGYDTLSACAVARPGGGASDGQGVEFGAAFLALFAAIAVRRRDRRALSRGIVLGALVLFASKEARADNAAPPSNPPAVAAPPEPSAPPPTELRTAPDAGASMEPIVRTPHELKDAIREHTHASPFAIAANVAGSFSDAALAGSLAVRLRLNKRFVLGLDGELNAFYGVDNGRSALGAVNAYATGIFRFPMLFEPINLRTTVEAGVSYELLALYGVPSGSIGPFVGLYPLGLEWKVSGRLFVIFNPLGIAVPIPHLTGTPFLYPQFRTNLGVEVAL